MKKFLLIFFIFILFGDISFAETRSVTVKKGYSAMYGYIPTPVYGAYTSCDPYFFISGGTKYYFVKGNNTPYTYKSLLGCYEDEKHSLFDPLRALNSDNDTEKLTPEELEATGIRFVKLKLNGYLALNDYSQDFNMKKVAYIDLRRTRFSTTVNPYGNFDIYVKRDSGSLKKIIGKVSAHTLYTVRRMF